jgi:hypothetical protein
MFSERKTNRPICYPCCCWPQTGKVYCFASYDDSPNQHRLQSKHTGQVNQPR